MRVTMSIAPRAVMLLLLTRVSCLAQTGGTADTSSPKLEKTQESLEIRFALSTLPPHLRDGATIYLLDPAKGYVLNRKGTNGVSCFVMRTEWLWPQFAFRDDIFVPMSYDEEGSKKMMPVWMDAAQMRARRAAPQTSLRRNHEKVWQRRLSEARTLGNLLYDCSAHPVLSCAECHGSRNFQRASLMFYSPNVKDANIGGKPSSPYPLVLTQVEVPTT